MSRIFVLLQVKLAVLLTLLYQHATFSVSLSEFADNGSLCDFLKIPGNQLDFLNILQWAKEIALGLF